MLSFRGPFGAYIIIKGGESQNAGNRVAEPGAYNTPALYRGPAAKRASRSFAGSWRATLYRAPCLQAGFAFARGRPVGERPAGVGSNRESLAPSEAHTHDAGASRVERAKACRMEKLEHGLIERGKGERSRVRRRKV